LQVPAIQGTAKIQLVYLQDTLDEIEVSDHPPAVTITSPNGGANPGETGPLLENMGCLATLCNSKHPASPQFTLQPDLIWGILIPSRARSVQT
jgi:hypothetical protein